MNNIIALLKNNGIEFDTGLNEEELVNAENKYNFHFPPDLRQLLSIALPIDSTPSKKRFFPNWRILDDEYTKLMVNWAKRCLEFDVEHNDFWLKSLGEKPDDKKQQLEILTYTLEKAPKLIPIFSHRFIPETPNESGNPVISLWQMTDAVYYGIDLEDYFITEFGNKKQIIIKEKPKKIKFWSELIEQ